MKRIAIQGELGSFHDITAHYYFNGDQLQIICCSTFEEVFAHMKAEPTVIGIMAIENTQAYHGLYHVLGGIISPMDGIGPGDIEIDSLVSRVAAGGIKEVILALSSTMEGDTTNFYITRQLKPFNIKQTVIARGISVGNELEYTDEVTLGRSIVNRTPIE